MKTLRYLRSSPVSTFFALVAAGLFVWYVTTGTNVSPFLLLVIAFAFHRSMWQGQSDDEIKRLREENEELYKQLNQWWTQ